MSVSVDGLRRVLALLALTASALLATAPSASAEFSFTRVDTTITDPLNPGNAQNAYAAVLADLDGQKGLDIVVANYGPPSGNAYNGAVAVLLNDGTGHFPASTLYDSGVAGTAGLVVRDFTGD